MVVRATRTLIAVLVVTIAFAVIGCSSDDGSADTTVGVTDGGNSGGESTSGGEPSGGGTATSGSSGLPPSVVPDFPVAIADGWVIDIHGEIGLTNVSGVQLLYPNDDFDRLVAYYEQWTDDQEASYAKTEADEFIIFSNLESGGTITITPNHEERDQTFVHLSIISP